MAVQSIKLSKRVLKDRKHETKHFYYVDLIRRKLVYKETVFIDPPPFLCYVISTPYVLFNIQFCYRLEK